MKKEIKSLKKLNIGCGKDYRKGWVNLDFNKEVKADIYCDLNKKLPIKDNEFDIILADNSIEHVQNLLGLIDEIWRISKHRGKIFIFVPHFSGIYASKHITHFHQFGIGTFDTFQKEMAFNGERYGDARFKILEQKLIYFHHNAAEIPILSKIPLNWIFNFGRKWGLIIEKFFPLKFDEIFFRLEVEKI